MASDMQVTPTGHRQETEVKLPIGDIISGLIAPSGQIGISFVNS